MQWIELSLKTTSEAVDWVRTLLATVDYAGTLEVQGLQSGEQSGEIQNRQPDFAAAPEPWAFAVRLVFPDDSQSTTRAEAIHQLLSPLERTGLTTALEIARLDHPSINAFNDRPNARLHRVQPRFVVLPPDLDYPAAPNEILLRLETTLAFGSGLHPATNLCLQLLERYVKSDVTPAVQALDLGSGSGILSVALAKLGAQVLALDNDPVAVQATQHAVQINQLVSQVTVAQGSLGKGNHLGHWMGGSVAARVAARVAAPVAHSPDLALPAFDLLVANILARIHVALAFDYADALKPNALLMTAGYTLDQAPDVDQALLAAGFVAIDQLQSGEWIASAYQLVSN